MTARSAAVGGVAAAGLTAAAARLWTRYRRAGDDVRRFADRTHERLADIGAVDRVEVLPLVERQVSRPDLAGEVGVSYLVTAVATQAPGGTASGRTRVLFDLGLNRRHSSRSALVRNAEVLGVDVSAVDAVVVSHAHDDHVGGPVALRRRRPALAGDTAAGPARAPLHVPTPMSHERMRPILTTGPRVVAPGVALLPPAPATMLWEGPVHEQALAVHVRGRGLVVVSGCGHPGVSVLVDLAAQVLGVGVHAVVGGLHLPVRGYWDIAVAGSPRPPWQLLGPADVDRAIDALDTAGVRVVALSGHDSTPWTARRFATAGRFESRTLRVGEPVVVGAATR